MFWKQFAKRFARRPMTENDLLSYCDGLITKFPPDKSLREFLIATRYKGSLTALDIWRRDIKALIAEIAAEKTWALQRQKLIRFRVAATSWIALWNAVGVETRTSLWRTYVQDFEVFRINPENTWPHLLYECHCNAAMNNAILSVTGNLCYSTFDIIEKKLNAFMELRQNTIEKALVLDRAIFEIAEKDFELGESLMKQRNERIHPKQKKQFDLLRDFADRIETGLVDVDAITYGWRQNSEAINAEILALSELMGVAIGDDYASAKH